MVGGEPSQELIDLFVGSSHGDLAKVKEVLAQTHTTGAHAIPVLYHAAIGGHIDIVELLVAHGADVNLWRGIGNPQWKSWLEAHAETMTRAIGWIYGDCDRKRRLAEQEAITTEMERHFLRDDEE